MLVPEASDKQEILNISHPSLKDRTRGVVDAVLKAVHREAIILPLSDEELSFLIERSHRNAMEHGNLWNPKKIITVKVIKTSDYLTIEIIDESPNARVEKMTDLRHFFRSESQETAIIRRYCEPMWNERGNLLQLRIPLTQAGLV